MTDEITAFLDELNELSNALYTLECRRYGLVPAGVPEQYMGQAALLQALDCTIQEAVHDSLSDATTGICSHLCGYIDFRKEVAHADITLVAAMLDPVVAMETKLRVKRELGLSNREALDFIADFRQRYNWIVTSGGYESYLNTVREWAPQFDACGHGWD